MRKYKTLLLLSLFIRCSSSAEKIDGNIEKTLPIRVAEVIAGNYFNKELSIKISEDILENYKKGTYNQLSEDSLISQLNVHLYKLSNDKHLRVIKNKKANQLPKSPPISQIAVLEGNIGYLKVNYFPDLDDAFKELISDSFNFLKNSNGIILDLRDNGGGYQSSAAFILSYFIDEQTTFDSFYIPRENKTISYKTFKKVIGEKLTEIPVKLLVGHQTSSSAEIMAYAFQNLEVGDVIGEPTQGMVNLADYYSLSDGTFLLYSKGYQKNPFTNQTIDGIGVTPDIVVNEINALSHAHKDFLEESPFLKLSNWFVEKGSQLTLPDVNEEIIGDYGFTSIEASNYGLIYNSENGVSYKLRTISDSVLGVYHNSNLVFKLLIEDNNDKENILYKIYPDGKTISMNKVN